MAEQYVSAFAIDAAVCFGLIGSHDEIAVRKTLKTLEDSNAADRLLRATDSDEVEAALREIVDDRLDPARAGGYGWLLELLGPTFGVPLGSVVLTGRGWDRLEGAFRSWDLAALADVWARPWTFPWGSDVAPDPDPWPFPMFASKTESERIHLELAAFDTDRIHADHDLLPDEDDADDVEWLLADNFPEWVRGARTRGLGLLLIRDGGK
ncbi:DUF7691 family protein [Embleya hyalina]|uniref:DUF7691 domain-containing protein n=1 Tax=Embleya hyalina TaxID=516124 RepID=A0A401Z2E3_9ACTN|nr:hypothetical protein [Embleya hyalina]GCE01053.1 hypothetical protein EHYA_08792 [Embleya hyalina]